jgi:hypothetical protein
MNNSNSFSYSQLPTNQKFGFCCTTMLITLAAYSYSKSWNTFTLISLVVALLFASSTLLAPHLLTPFNRLWFRLGVLLGKVSSPIVLGFIFLFLIIPISLFMRLIGRDELRLKKQIVESYWIDRAPPGPPSDSFKNQF